MAKKELSPIERKLKALEDYLDIVFESDEEYPEYHNKEYALIKRLTERIEKLEAKVLPKKEAEDNKPWWKL